MQFKESYLWALRALCLVSDTPELDAMLLLTHVLNITRVELMTQMTRQISASEWTTFQSLVDRRQAGWPIAYLVEQREFWSLSLHVTPECLIPRPETELLVEHILAYYPKEMPIRCADLGTGSGAIALALASERPHWQIVATDQSHTALKVAEKNRHYLATNGYLGKGKKSVAIEFKQGNWLDALSSMAPFHCIVSNPPYLSEQDPYLLNRNLKYEPREALVAGVTGMEAYHQIIRQAKQHLLPTGKLWLEQGFNQAFAVAALLRQYGYNHIHQYKDLANITRITVGEVS